MLKKFVAVSLGVASSVSMAAAPALDFTPLTGAINFSSVVTAVLAVGVILCGVHVAIAGAKIVIRMVKGA